MIITLYLNDKLIKFRLPSQISGSYSFDFEETETKLINVESRNGKWVLYKTSEVGIMSNNAMIDSIELIPDNFYFLKRNNQNYIIYVNQLKTNNLLAYQYDTKLNLLIGNSDISNIRYNCYYLKNLNIKITNNENKLLLENESGIQVYLNSKAITTKKVELKNGDQIELFGLKIMFFNNIMLVNNIANKIIFSIGNSNIALCNFPIDDVPQDIDVKDIDLYTKDDYYSKSPRLRRLVETKKIKLTSPPNNNEMEEMPLILTVGPMVTMGIMSAMTLVNIFTRMSSKQATIGDSWPQIITSIAMILTTILWPIIIRKYNVKAKKKKRKEIIEKYTNYLNEKKIELDEEVKNQSVILNENLITIDECLNIIRHKNINFWDKRVDQNDFLTVRIGNGNGLLNVEIDYNEEDFTVEEDELRKKADELKSEYKYINNVPVGYSFYENKTTAIMGKEEKVIHFMNNIILQLLTFYSYDDLKFVVFTNKKNNEKWQYLKYLNHTFSNDRTIRFYSTDQESSKNIADYLNAEINNRINMISDNVKNFGQQYFIIIDGYENVKRYDFVKTLTEIDDNIGMNLVFIENKLSNLPSKCNNFMIINDGISELLKNSYEKQEKIEFTDEIRYDLDMFSITKELSNIPIEFAEGIKELPNSISFLEMEKVGKVEQLNILNRWNTNDPTQSLKAEIGIDERGDLMYLDLHEKYHGPHGLIAGMTGSGKSEFIITYILSMSINFSPDDVSFILIDYKGGGLAFAFENKSNGMILPHLAGTITNLDKAEMDRTLVSIDSEIKRRQQKFNEARDLLGESTMDIYKYQRYYKEGRINEPIPHLFIICDEFAELKAQQPDFMDNLISVARIGRSLGVHLILATQKPSGVVNDQIWSNTKFRVCLKVQDESDSKEMLKRSEAASLKQAGRFYLQVGYDEYFALGQSGFSGAKYYPSEKIVKNLDKSINFIDDSGSFIKSIQSSNGPKIQAQGEQLSAIMNSIIEVANMTGKKSKKLWLDNIPPIILVDDLRRKYNIIPIKYSPSAIIGEYDAPEMQEQGIVLYDFLEDGNTIIYGMDGNERENILNSIIYSSTSFHTSDEINYYIIDYGSEVLSIYNTLPHIGGMVFASDDEKLNNLIKLIKQEIKIRKKLFADYGGEYKLFIKNSGKKIPLKVVIINNFDSFFESKQELYDVLPELVRDSERYGIIFIFTVNSANSVYSKLLQSFKNMYTLRLKDSSGYSSIFDQVTKLEPREITGRGLFRKDDIHEFQTASIVNDKTSLNKYLIDFIEHQKQINKDLAINIPMLPKYIRFNDVKVKYKDLSSLPIGITKNDLEVATIDCLQQLGTMILSNKIQNTNIFVKSLLMELRLGNYNSIVIDPLKTLNIKMNNYFTSDFDNLLDNLNVLLQKQIESKTKTQSVILINGITKFLASLNDKSKFDNLIENIKKYENMALFIVDAGSKIKDLLFEGWFNSLFSINDGIWIGKGIADQSIIRLSTITKDMTIEYKNDMGYFVQENSATLLKYIDFITEGDKNEK